MLQTATGEPAGRWWSRRWRPPCEDGLLVAEPGAQQAVRFRHDRLREAVLAGLDPSRRRDLQLGMARRLAGGAGAVRGRRRAVPAGGRRGDDASRAAGRGRPAAPRRRPGSGDRGLRADEHAAGRRAAADRPRGDRHAGRGAHRSATPPCTAWGGWRRPTRNTGPSRRSARPRWTRVDATAVQVRSLTHRNRFAGCDRPRSGRAARARHHRPDRGPARRRGSTTSSAICTGGSTGQRRRPGPARDHRPEVARRDPADQRGPAGGVLHGRPGRRWPG